MPICFHSVTVLYSLCDLFCLDKVETKNTTQYNTVQYNTNQYNTIHTEYSQWIFGAKNDSYPPGYGGPTAILAASAAPELFSALVPGQSCFFLRMSAENLGNAWFFSCCFSRFLLFHVFPDFRMIRQCFYSFPLAGSWNIFRSSTKVLHDPAVGSEMPSLSQPAAWSAESSRSGHLYDIYMAYIYIYGTPGLWNQIKYRYNPWVVKELPSFFINEYTLYMSRVNFYTMMLQQAKFII